MIGGLSLGFRLLGEHSCQNFHIGTYFLDIILHFLNFQVKFCIYLVFSLKLFLQNLHIILKFVLQQVLFFLKCVDFVCQLIFFLPLSLLKTLVDGLVGITCACYGFVQNMISVVFDGRNRQLGHIMVISIFFCDNFAQELVHKIFIIISVNGFFKKGQNGIQYIDNVIIFINILFQVQSFISQTILFANMDKEENPKYSEKGSKNNQSKKNEYRGPHREFSPSIQFNMSLDESPEQDLQILSNLQDVSLSELWENSQYSKDQMKKAFQKLLNISKKIYHQNLHFKQREPQLKGEIQQLYEVIEQLQEHNQMLQDDCHNIRVLMTQLQQKKQKQIQQISYSEEEIKKSCLELSIELQTMGSVKMKLILAEEVLKRKQQEIRVMEQQFQRRNKKYKQLQHQNHQLKGNINILSFQLQNTMAELRREKDEHKKFKQQSKQLISISEQYKTIINNKASIPEDILQLQSSSSFSERNQIILQAHNEDDHEMLKNIQKICEQNSYISQLRNPTYVVTDLEIGKTKKKNKKYNEPISERKVKKEQRSFHTRKRIEEEDKSSFDKKSISGISATSIHQIFTERVKVKEEVDKKYERQVGSLRRQNFKLRAEIQKYKQEIVLKQDLVTQTQGQLQMKEDKIQSIVSTYRQALYENSHLLEMQRIRVRQTRQNSFRQKLQAQKANIELKLNYQDLLMKNELLKDKLRQYAQKVQEKIKYEIEKYCSKMINQNQKQVKEYVPQLKKRLSLKNRKFTINTLYLQHFQFERQEKPSYASQTKIPQFIHNSVLSVMIDNFTDKMDENVQTETQEKVDEQIQTIEKEHKEEYTQCPKVSIQEISSQTHTQYINQQVQTQTEESKPAENYNNYYIQTNFTNNFNIQTSCPSFKGNSDSYSQTPILSTQQKGVDGKVVSSLTTQTDQIQTSQKQIDIAIQVQHIEAQTIYQLYLQDIGVNTEYEYDDKEVGTYQHQFQQISFHNQQMHQNMENQEIITICDVILEEDDVNNEEQQQINMQYYERDQKKQMIQITSLKFLRKEEKSQSSENPLKENTSQNVSSKHERQDSKSSNFSASENKSQSGESKKSKIKRKRNKSSFSLRDLDLLKNKKPQIKRNFEGHPEIQKYPKILTERLDVCKFNQLNENVSTEFIPKTAFVDSPSKQKEDFLEFLTEKSSNFLKKFINLHKLTYETFSQSKKDFRWNSEKLYVCEGKNSSNDKTDTLVLWKTGLISMQLSKAVMMKKTKRIIKDDNMYILGNCEVIAEQDTISLKRSHKKNLFDGNLPDNTWKIEKVSIYGIQ